MGSDDAHQNKKSEWNSPEKIDSFSPTHKCSAKLTVLSFSAVKISAPPKLQPFPPGPAMPEIGLSPLRNPPKKLVFMWLSSHNAINLLTTTGNGKLRPKKWWFDGDFGWQTWHFMATPLRAPCPWPKAHGGCSSPWAARPPGSWDLSIVINV